MRDPINTLRLRPSGLAESTCFPTLEAPLAQVLGLVTELRSMVDVARALVETGRRVDLAGLDNQIGVLCARTLDLEPEEGRTARLELIRLRADIDRLATKLIRPPKAG